MRKVFTTFATTRFIDQEAVKAAFRDCAQRLMEQQNEVVAVFLFGSFATGKATPRSDADILVEITSAQKETQESNW